MRKTDINIIVCAAQRIRPIIKDGINIELEQLLNANENATARCHKNCVSTCTSNTHVKRYLRKYNTVFCTVGPHFSFLEHYIFCGETCTTDIDLKTRVDGAK